MLEIGKTLISLDVITKKFCCDLTSCLGSCCVHGDSGAPLNSKELELIEEVYPVVKPYLRPEGIKAIEELGRYVIDGEDEPVTTLVNEGECAYVIFENGISFCGIEKAYRDGKITWIKPLSCHLYPIRIKEYKNYDAVNYDEWEICRSALKKGKGLGLHVYLFVKDALIRAYGEEWFDQLDYAAKNLDLE